MRRLTYSLPLVVLTAIFCVGIALDTLFERYYSPPDDELKSLQALASGLAEFFDQSVQPELSISSLQQHNLHNVNIDTIDTLSLPPELKRQFVQGEPLLLESEELVSLHYYLPGHEKVLSINTSVTTNDKSGTIALLFTSMFYGGTMLLVLLWLTPLLSRLTMLRRTTRSFGAGELTSRVPPTGISYIRDIEDDFNGMADRIQQLVEDNKLLTSAVSHDLRTPLARLRFGVDTLAESSDPQARAQYQLRINRDLSEMENLVNSLLRYARLDNVLEDVSKQQVSIRELIHECTAQYYDSKITINIDDSALQEGDRLCVIGCIDHLATAFNNLIQNATEYAGSQLIIQLSRTNSSINLTFTDDGPGIPVQRRKDLLKPFQRGEDNSNNGYGLGLAVVDRIARHHHATVSIDGSTTLCGASITLSFALNCSQPVSNIY